jgi:xylan 1,4-beta-xylosidase
MLPSAFQWLRTPKPERIFSLIERPGHLRLFGRETIGSHFEQALVARRQTAFRYDVRTLIDYEPEHFQQAAGIVAYYNSTKYHFLQITAGDAGEKLIEVLSVLPHGEGQSLMTPAILVPSGPIELRAVVDHEELRFAFRAEGAGEWTWLPQHFDASILSDEVTLAGLPNFTGAFVGMACQDMSGSGHPADFRYFHYNERLGAD